MCRVLLIPVKSSLYSNLLIFKEIRAEVLAHFCHGCRTIHCKNHNIISFFPQFNATKEASSKSEETNLLFKRTCMQMGYGGGLSFYIINWRVLSFSAIDV